VSAVPFMPVITLLNYLKIMLNKKKLLGNAARLLKLVQQEGKVVVNASKPMAKNVLGKISDGAVTLGEKGKKLAEDMNTNRQTPDQDKD
jgi:hypothetical protein